MQGLLLTLEARGAQVPADELFLLLAILMRRLLLLLLPQLLGDKLRELLPLEGENLDFFSLPSCIFLLVCRCNRPIG